MDPLSGAASGASVAPEASNGPALAGNGPAGSGGPVPQQPPLVLVPAAPKAPRLARVKPPRLARVKHQLPETWAPNSAHRELAKAIGVDASAQAEQFRDHFAANGEPKQDWDAAFRNWIRRSPAYAPRPANGQRWAPPDYRPRKL